MLTIKECNLYLKDYNLSDNEIKEIRDALYYLIGGIYDDLYEQKENQ